MPALKPHPKETPPPRSPGELDPAGTARRQHQLEAILKKLRAAQFPRDYAEFEPWADPLRKETKLGQDIQKRWTLHVSQGRAIPGVPKPPLACPPAIFLPLLQAALLILQAALPMPSAADELRARFRREREAIARDPLPARRAKIMERIKRREEKAWLDLVHRLGFLQAAFSPAGRTRIAQRLNAGLEPCGWNQSRKDEGEACLRNGRSAAPDGT
jgi:hypothetical protein